MSGIAKFIVGLICLVVLGYLGFYAGIIKSESSVALENKLQRIADDKTASNEFGWADIKMNGQKAVITGTAPNDEARDKLRKLVLGSEWSGGVVSGGVTKVDVSGIKLATSGNQIPLAKPYSWNATYPLKDGPVTLTGFVPSEEARAALVAEAKTLFPDGVVDEMQVARGVPSPTWSAAALQNLKALQMLDRGGVNAVDAEFTLFGEVDDITHKTRAEASLANFESGYTSLITVSAPEPVIIEEPAPVEEPVVEAPAPAPTVAIDTCQDEFNSALKDKINFASSRAVIRPASFPVLDQLATVAKKCAGYRIEIQGHTDSSGPAEMNMNLSQMRADAVLTYLGNKGVNTTGYLAKGYGENVWVGDNRTADGRAANRRIEFKVSAN